MVGRISRQIVGPCHDDSGGKARLNHVRGRFILVAQPADGNPSNPPFSKGASRVGSRHVTALQRSAVGSDLLPLSESGERAVGGHLIAIGAGLDCLRQR
jgi:hypothetical protein